LNFRTRRVETSFKEENPECSVPTYENCLAAQVKNLLLITWNLRDYASYCLPGTPESGCMMGALPPALSQGGTRADVPFYKSIIGNFMVDQNWLETNLLQLIVHPETSDWFSIISGIIFWGQSRCWTETSI